MIKTLINKRKGLSVASLKRCIWFDQETLDLLKAAQAYCSHKTDTHHYQATKAYTIKEALKMLVK